jgi:hypothetical protein
MITVINARPLLSQFSACLRPPQSVSSVNAIAGVAVVYSELSFKAASSWWRVLRKLWRYGPMKQE